jgi:uncharacterized membrane protein
MSDPDEKHWHMSEDELAAIKDDPRAQEILQQRIRQGEMADQLAREMLESIKKLPPVH